MFLYRFLAAAIEVKNSWTIYKVKESLKKYKKCFISFQQLQSHVKQSFSLILERVYFKTKVLKR